MLHRVVQARPSDATAKYLLGTFYFSRGLTDRALGEWADARKSGPNLPVVSASTGLALLHIKNDAQGALSAFQEGLRSDPTNIANYLGMDQALSLLNRPPRERVEALQKFPKLDAAPPALIFESILNLTEAGDFERATSLFHNRFFPREEGGTTFVRCGLKCNCSGFWLWPGRANATRHWRGRSMWAPRFQDWRSRATGLTPFFNREGRITCLPRRTALAENPRRRAPDFKSRLLLPPRTDPLGVVGGAEASQLQRGTMERPAAIIVRASRQSQRNQRLSKLVDVYGGFAGKGVGQNPGSGRSAFEKLCCYPIACWPITSLGWPDRRVAVITSFLPGAGPH